MLNFPLCLISSNNYNKTNLSKYIKEARNYPAYQTIILTARNIVFYHVCMSEPPTGEPWMEYSFVYSSSFLGQFVNWPVKTRNTLFISCTSDFDLEFRPIHGKMRWSFLYESHACSPIQEQTYQLLFIYCFCEWPPRRLPRSSLWTIISSFTGIYLWF